MIDFYGQSLLAPQVTDPAEQGPFYNINVAGACGLSVERANELNTELAAKWKLMQESPCDCNNCRNERQEKGEQQPEHGGSLRAFLNSVSLQLDTPNEILFVGLNIGRLIGKEEAAVEHKLSHFNLLGKLFGNNNNQ